MRVTIVPEDQYIAVDYIGYNINTEYDQTVHAIQWYDTHGTIEYKAKAAETFTDISKIQPYINAFMEQRRINNRQS